ncbi:MAG: Gfo/Idh/MocA family protein [Anaerolineae bacterium]
MTPTTSTLRVGILGQGRSGRDIHAQYLINDKRYQIVAVADALVERAARAVKEYGCVATEDYRQVLARKDLDFVINALPSHLHVPVTREALEAGQNVLCEKPFGRRAAEVDELMALAERSGRRLAVFQQSRFAPAFRQVRQVIASGVLGRLVMIKMRWNGYGRRWDWQTLQEMNGGSLLNTGPHPVDQALQLLDVEGAPQVWCHMDRVNTYGDAEDHVKLLLSAPERPVIDLEISSCAAYSSYAYEVYGASGGLAGSMTHLDWKWFDPEQAPAQQLIREPLPGPSYCREELPWQSASWDVPEAEKDLFGTAVKAFYDHLYQVYTSGADWEVTLPQVRQQIAVMEECHRLNPLSRLTEQG